MEYKKIHNYIGCGIGERFKKHLANENPVDIHDELVIKSSVTVEEFEDHELSIQISSIIDEMNLKDLEDMFISPQFIGR